MINNTQKLISSEKFRFYLKKGKFVANERNTRIKGSLCKQILLRSEKTKKVLLFEKYFEENGTYWFRNIETGLIIELQPFK